MTKQWRLLGHDSFSREDYPLEGGWPTEEAAREAARARLAHLERGQPSSMSGGQAGVQDRVYVVRPDGSRYRYASGSLPPPKPTAVGATGEELAEALAGLCGLELSAPHVCVHPLTQPQVYVQFCSLDGAMLGEAVSNRWLPPALQLDARREGLLLQLGWRPPTEGRPNWHRTFPSAFDCEPEVLAQLALHTLAEVYRVPADAPLVLRCSWDRG